MKKFLLSVLLLFLVKGTAISVSPDLSVVYKDDIKAIQLMMEHNAARDAARVRAKLESMGIYHTNSWSGPDKDVSIFIDIAEECYNSAVAYPSYTDPRAKALQSGWSTNPNPLATITDNSTQNITDIEGVLELDDDEPLPQKITLSFLLHDPDDPDNDNEYTGAAFNTTEWVVGTNSLAIVSTNTSHILDNGTYAYPADNSGSIKHILVLDSISQRFSSANVEDDWDDYCKLEVKFYTNSGKTTQIGSTYDSGNLGGISYNRLVPTVELTSSLQTSYYVEAKLIDVSSTETIFTESTTINLKAGADFDGDGDVDGADYNTWAANYPTASSATPSMGDADLDGDVDGADYTLWQAQYPCGQAGQTPCSCK